MRLSTALVLLFAFNAGCDAEVPRTARMPPAPTVDFKDFTYLDPEYPFLRIDETPDGLQQFLRKSSTPPDIVIVQVEGLGRAFSGRGAYLGSFTPFLDALADRSLYWENFLASQGRTFASLPSILGSLPYGTRGFSDLGRRMPRHFSLMNILKHNGYRTAFICGEDLGYDNQGLFMTRQGVDHLVGIEDYDRSFIRPPPGTLGYPDREILRKALEMTRQNSSRPHLTYVQTISIHGPYAIPENQKYLDRFEERMSQLGFSAKKKERYRSFRKIYAAILYADDALRYFFEEYAKLPAYKNTIFVVTGDHRLIEIPMATKIDRYHVPLLIFSPLLERPARFKSISSHLDITPSLLAFLKNGFHLKTPSSVAWIGSGLDVETTFRNVHRYPLKLAKDILINHISNVYFIDEKELFSVGPTMDLEPMQNEAIRRRLQEEFEQYQKKNSRFAQDLKLIPYSVYDEFFAN